jgi:competence protein CoiA
MLIARQANGQVVQAHKDLSRQANYHCLGCQTPVRLKAGKTKMPHFAHVSVADCHYLAEAESVPHLTSKLELADWFKQDCPNTKIEAYLPPLAQTPDILVNDTLAIEVQYSPLPYDRLTERTLTYREYGYQVIWLLGDKLHLGHYLTQLKSGFVYFHPQLGYYYWEIHRKPQPTLVLRYLLHQQLDGKLRGLTLRFAFMQANLLSILALKWLTPEFKPVMATPELDIPVYIEQVIRSKNPKWRSTIEQLYLQGQTLRDIQFVSTLYPLGYDPIFKREMRFLQIDQITDYETNFDDYHQNHPVKHVMNPTFYESMLHLK